MIDTTQLTNLISAFRVETEKESISPETVGKLLQDITDLLANASTTAELQILENWKAILSQLNLVESVEQGVTNVEHVNIVLSLRDLANGGYSGQNFQIAPATAQRAGVMTAAQAQILASLNDAVSALQLAAVNCANKNTEQDEKLDIIQQGPTVMTDITQGGDSTTKVNLTIKKKSLVSGNEFTNISSRQIAAATNQKAGVMTKAHVQALEKAATDIGNLRYHVDLLRQPQLYVTGIEPRPIASDRMYIGVEMTDVWTGHINEAEDDIEFPAATAQQAGVMSAQHVKRLENVERQLSSGSVLNNIVSYNNEQAMYADTSKSDGTIAHEMNSEKFYIYNEPSDQWHRISSYEINLSWVDDVIDGTDEIADTLRNLLERIHNGETLALFVKGYPAVVSDCANGTERGIAVHVWHGQSIKTYEIYPNHGNDWYVSTKML